ncbi:MAG: SEC-C domain-containing protein [Solirubrobacterales bacterium]|nr:SEC-C domain-containing protein [Solirubrobacterales bacterium]
MPGPGRNDPCPCGSGRKVKRCCGQHRGPGENDLARAYLAHQARVAARKLRHLDEDELHDLFDELFDLPELDLTLTITLPQLLTPHLQHLFDAIKADDVDAGDDVIPTILERPTRHARRTRPPRPRSPQTARLQAPRLAARRRRDHRPRQPLATPAPRQPHPHRVHPHRPTPNPRRPAPRRLTRHRTPRRHSRRLTRSPA